MCNVRAIAAECVWYSNRSAIWRKTCSVLNIIENIYEVIQTYKQYGSMDTPKLHSQNMAGHVVDELFTKYSSSTCDRFRCHCADSSPFEFVQHTTLLPLFRHGSARCCARFSDIHWAKGLFNSNVCKTLLTGRKDRSFRCRSFTCTRADVSPRVNHTFHVRMCSPFPNKTNNCDRR